MSIADQITKAWNNANATVDQYALKAKKAPKSSDLQTSLFETAHQPALPGHGGWNEEAHPRVAKGSQQAHGGQFTSKDALPGGKADGKPDSAFIPTLLEQGKKVESEHTDKPAIAKEIAKDHLSEDPNYYDKLKKMEQGPKSGFKPTLIEQKPKQATAQERIASLGMELNPNRVESLHKAIDAGVDEKTLKTLAVATRLARKKHIVIPAGRFENLSRGRGWARKGRGESAEWGERADSGGYKLSPGKWTIGSTDGFNRKEQVEWIVKHIKVGNEIWTVAD